MSGKVELTRNPHFVTTFMLSFRSPPPAPDRLLSRTWRDQSCPTGPLARVECSDQVEQFRTISGRSGEQGEGHTPVRTMRAVADEHVPWRDKAREPGEAAAPPREHPVDIAPPRTALDEACLGLQASSRRACTIGRR